MHHIPAISRLFAKTLEESTTSEIFWCLLLNQNTQALAPTISLFDAKSTRIPRQSRTNREFRQHASRTRLKTLNNAKTARIRNYGKSAQSGGILTDTRKVPKYQREIRSYRATVGARRASHALFSAELHLASHLTRVQYIWCIVRVASLWQMMFPDY